MFTIKFGNKSFSRISVGTSSFGKISKRVNIIKPITSKPNSTNISPAESVKLFDNSSVWRDDRNWDDSVTINFN